MVNDMQEETGMRLPSLQQLAHEHGDKPKPRTKTFPKENVVPPDVNMGDTRHTSKFKGASGKQKKDSVTAFVKESVTGTKPVNTRNSSKNSGGR